MKRCQIVDGRDKPGHDEFVISRGEGLLSVRSDWNRTPTL